MNIGIGIGVPIPTPHGEWTPMALSGGSGGIKLWLRADAQNMVLTGTSVDEWRDMSPSGAHFQDQGAKPTWNVSDADFGGQSSLSFNGTTQELALITTGTLAGAGASHSFWCVYKSATANDGARHVMLDTGTTPYGSPNHIGFTFGVTGTNELGFLFGGTRTDVTGGTQTTAVRRDAWVCDGAANTWELFQNGVSAGTAAYGTDNALVSGTTATVGCDVSGVGNFSGKIAEIVLVNRVFTAAELSLLETYYASRYT